MSDVDELFDVPEPGKKGFRFLPGATNFWRYIAFSKCARPFYVYLAAFVPAIIEAYITVRVLDLEDIFRDKARDFAKAGARATRRSFRHTRKPRYLGATKPTSRISQKALVLALRWSQPLENIGFKLLLVGAADQFFYRFTSLIMSADFCDQPIQSGPLQRARSAGRQSIGPGGRSVLLPILQQNRANWPTGSASVSLPAGAINIIFSGRFMVEFTDLDDVALKLDFDGGIWSRTVFSERQDMKEREWVGFVIQVQIFAGGLTGGTLTWEIDGPAVPIGIAADDAWISCERVG